MKTAIKHPGELTGNEIREAIRTIGKWDDLSKFQKLMSEAFAEKYNISQGQVRFLVSLVEHKRVNTKIKKTCYSKDEVIKMFNELLKDEHVKMVHARTWLNEHGY
jgi:galactokinase